MKIKQENLPGRNPSLTQLKKNIKNSSYSLCQCLLIATAGQDWLGNIWKTWDLFYFPLPIGLSLSKKTNLICNLATLPIPAPTGMRNEKEERLPSKYSYFFLSKQVIFPYWSIQPKAKLSKPLLVSYRWVCEKKWKPKRTNESKRWEKVTDWRALLQDQSIFCRGNHCSSSVYSVWIIQHSSIALGGCVWCETQRDFVLELLQYNSSSSMWCIVLTKISTG